jgi:hypothetical protein
VIFCIELDKISLVGIHKLLYLCEKHIRL